MYRRLLILVLLLSGIAAVVSAQEITPRTPQQINPDATISWPPPVYVLRGNVELRGTANLPGMTSYFVEFRPLILTLDAAGGDDEPLEEGPWFPATLPSSLPVIDGILGAAPWNTRTAPDGLYEIRLTIFRTGQDPFHFVVSPLRVENDPPPFVVDEFISPVATPIDTAPVARPTLAPSPTALDTTPRVTAIIDANVRAGDGVGYTRIDVLRQGQVARVVGISTSGNGWYFIELPDGTRGWIAPSTVSASGDLRSVPRVNPPATPTPPATNTPVPSGNLSGSAPSINPNPPTCNVQFEVLVNITNIGNARTTGPATIVIRDLHVATNTVQASVIREVPALDPGQNWVAGAQFIITTYYNEEHRIEVIIDPNNLVPETIETDNYLFSSYILQRGGC